MFTTNFFGDAIAKLQAARNTISNPTPILQQIAAQYQQQVERSFDREQDPDDNSPWADLTPATLRQKQLHYPGTKKLVRSGSGKRSVRVLVRGIAIWADMNETMQYHHTGTRKMPKRNFIPEKIDEDLVQGVVARVVFAILQ
ncbi:MAG: phage virion morphogenesis protein [Rhizonema sp. NSF051]|nr:phage virion morphogenesis protein [Rhizonema sp. NSF051]